MAGFVGVRLGSGAQLLRNRIAVYFRHVFDIFFTNAGRQVALTRSNHPGNIIAHPTQRIMFQDLKALVMAVSEIHAGPFEASLIVGPLRLSFRSSCMANSVHRVPYRTCSQYPYIRLVP